MNNYNILTYCNLFIKCHPKFCRNKIGNVPEVYWSISSFACRHFVMTWTVFENLGERIVSGTILLFDEFYNYDEYANDEFKAFQEFLQRSGKMARYIAFNQYWEQVAACIL